MSKSESHNRLFPKIAERQGYHLLILFLLVAGIIAAGNMLPLREGELFGISSITWFWATISAAIVHQVYTVIMWRVELHGDILSHRLGSKSFSVFKSFFALFGLSRFLIIPLAISNRATLELHGSVQWGLSSVLLILSFYLFYSVIRWFGIDRAAGLDHFKPKDAREWEFVREGIFRFTSNGMYIFGFMFFWIPGLFFESAAALLAALFFHIYIWVHYYCTEKPDMKFIYS